MQEDYFDNKIVICTLPVQKYLLKCKKNLVNFKLMSMREFQENILFSYDDRAILYLMHEYDYSYEIAKEYIENLYFIKDENYDNTKLKLLKQIKEKLDQNKLLIYNDIFKDYAKNKKIIVYNYPLSKYEKYLLKDYDYEQIDDRKEKYSPKIYEFESTNDEITFVCNEICKLILSGVSPREIKLTNVSGSYPIYLDKYFKLFNLKIENAVKCMLNATIVGKTFLDNLENGIENAIQSINQYQQLKSYKQIIGICNKYVCYEEKEQIFLIKKALSNTPLQQDSYTNEIEYVDLDSYHFTNEYVFLIGFNEGIIPTYYKDEDFITDSIKPDYLDTTNEKNIFIKTNTIKNILSIPNLTITYKLKDDFKTYYPSNLIDYLNVSVQKINNSYDNIYSILNAKINASYKLDNYLKYNEKDDSLALLLSNFSISYNTYSHAYNGINNKLLNDYLEGKEKFVLSYSSIDNYYRCAFRFLIANILNISDYEEKFSVILGNIYHYVLEKNEIEVVDVEKLVKEYIEKNNICLSKSNEFFLNKAIINMKYLQKVLKEQKSMSLLDRVETEKKIELPLKDNFYFKGFIDKIYYGTDNGKLISAIIDYKTYVKKPTLRYLDYGISMQLPIYMYLAKKINPNIYFAGFYMQNILLDNKSDEEKRKSLKLIGYSNVNKDILKYLDYEYDNSTVISGIKLNKDGNFSSASLKNMVSDEKINEITNKVEDKINAVIDNIKQGNFKINPKFDHENIGCEFCPYHDICYKKEYDYEYLNIKEGEENA